MATSFKGLTSEEAALIDKYLWFYTGLAEGRRRPTTPAQEHFLAVCTGAAAPETAHEVVFLKYREQLAVEEREVALERQQEYQCKLADYEARQNSSLMESDEDRWW
jgi:uncharacterized protein YifE (UPF0438 family)